MPNKLSAIVSAPLAFTVSIPVNNTSNAAAENRGLDLLDAWPVPQPSGWLELVNGVETAEDLSALRRSVQRGSPFGSEVWQQETALRLGLQNTLKPQGRPRKSKTTATSGPTLFSTTGHRSDAP